MLSPKLRRQGWPLIDAQVENDHLKTLGAVTLPRADFLDIVAQQVALPVPAGDWQARFGVLAARDLANPD